MMATQLSRQSQTAPPAPGQVVMRAIVQRRYGTAPGDVLRLARIARPAIAANEVLVQVRAAGLDRGAWHLMAGQPYLVRLPGIGRQIRAVALSPLVRQRLTMYVSRQRQTDLETLRRLIEAGQLTPVIGRTYPLSEATAAVRHLAEGHARGKIAITI